MIRRAALTVAAWTAAAAAVAAPLHDEPAKDDNTRIFVLVDAPATVSLDRTAPVTIAAQSVVFARLGAGAHAWTVSLPDGSRASADVTLSAAEMIESKGRRWWCLAAGRRDGQLTLLRPEPARCKSLADVAPD